MMLPVSTVWQLKYKQLSAPVFKAWFQIQKIFGRPWSALKKLADH